MKPVLFIFAKAPFMGKAKTRLAADIGQVHAHRVYRALTARILRNCRDPRWDTVLYVTPDRAARRGFGGLWPDNLPRYVQHEGDLSARLTRIYRLKGPVLAIGTDAPQVGRADIARAIKALKTNNAVFGPAADGGFWLIGMNGPVRADVFENVRWSHPETLADLKANLGGKPARLRILEDIDNEASLRRWLTA